MTYSSAIFTSVNSNSTAARAANMRRGQNNARFTSSFRSLGPITNAIILAILLCLIGLIYLMQTTRTNTYGYDINTLKSKKVQLEQESESLQVESARLQSVERVKTSPVAATMTAPVATTFAGN